MRPRALAPALLLTALLAVPLSAPAAEGDQTLPWSLLDCTFAYGTVPVRAERLAPFVPAGFGLTWPFGILSSPATPLVQLAFEIDDCRAGEGLAGLVAPMQWANFWVQATPPPSLVVEGGQFYTVGWDVLIPDADRRGAMLGAGLPARDGHIAVDITAEVPDLPEARTLLRADYELEGLGAFHMEAVGGPVSTLGGGGNFVTYIARADGGVSRWRTDWAPADGHAGPGTISVPAGSWLAEVVDSPIVPARFTFGKWSYTGGSIDLLA